ncbi:MAG: carbohydrate porin [Verrucomicrobia bacterium]|nr:MAG: carbohydrate porin [Verrucomicrobiota bacterium]
MKLVLITSDVFSRLVLFFVFLVMLFVSQSLKAEPLSPVLNNDDPNPLFHINQLQMPESNLDAGLETTPDQNQSIRKFQPWLEKNNATGDWFGVRDTLSKEGIDLGFSFINEVWGNTTGGMKTGSVYASVLQLATTVNLEKIIHWKGGTFYSRWLYLDGQDPSVNLVGDIFGVSSITGYSTIRNIELWLEQTFFDDKISLRVGQMDADSEFVISDYAALFLNNTLGWPAFIFTSIPNGGPGYPVGAPGVRLKLEPNDQFSFKAALFQGNVYPQNVNNHGFDWNLNSNQGYLYLTEAAYRYHCTLPGKIKAGAWFSSSTFTNFSNPNDSFPGNYGIYGIIDQKVYCPNQNVHQSDSKPNDIKITEVKSDQGLGVFHRIAFEPGDRNIFNFYCDSGLNYKGIIPTRNQDLLGLAFVYGLLSNQGISTIQQNKGTSPANTAFDIELTYQAQLTPWFTVQPDIQYVIHPGVTQAYPNAFVVGMRASMTF